MNPEAGERQAAAGGGVAAGAAGPGADRAAGGGASPVAAERVAAPRGWYAWLLGGLVPLLVGGFVVSALADRLVFAGWALAAAAAYAAALRWSWGRVLRGAAKPALGWAAPLAVLAVAAVLFALLARRHREDLTLGFAAMRPPLPVEMPAAGPAPAAADSAPEAPATAASSQDATAPTPGATTAPDGTPPAPEPSP
jgi:hypothetical protein